MFTALAAGGGGSAVVHHLREAQLSKHLMLLTAIAEAASGGDAAAIAFRAGYELLTRIQAADPGAYAWLLALPHLGGWAHDCLIRLEQRSAPDLAYFACAAATTAVRAGFPFEFDVPVRDGRVLLPGLGSVRVSDGESQWIRLRCDGERVQAGRDFEADRRLLVPDDGSGGTVAQWCGTPIVRAVTDGQAWEVLLETRDVYLDRYTLPMSTGLPAGEISRWRHRVQDAWQVLVRHHRWAAEPIAGGISVIIPLTSCDTDLVSATSPAAFGAIATSWPSDRVTAAETLVHEFQHVKLAGLMDMVPLVQPGGERVYAPWRQDPRPAGGLLQGIYAHLGIARFWRAQRNAETDPDSIFRAQAAFARWRSTIDPAIHALLRTGCLTEAGVRFAGLVRDQGRHSESESVPACALQAAQEVALDHWLTWQVRHMAIESSGVARLAAAYQRGESCAAQPQPNTWVEEQTRKVGSAVRSQLLNTRYLAPARYRDLCADGVLPLGEADRLLVRREAASAVQAYREEIAGSADRQPDAWIGLALALHQLPSSPLQTALTTRLPLIFDVHACLGGRADPLDLAAWFA